MSKAERGEPADILLVEDNPGDVRLTKEAIADGNLAIALHVVRDGVEAMEFLRRQGDHTDAPRPDIVLLDLNLPRMDGDEVLEEIRADDELRQLPVIVLTGSDAQEDVLTSYGLCANAYVTKPVNPTEFVETIRSFQSFWLSTVRLPPCPNE